ncbi:MAG: c-type cytochrome domain-containing protein [Desulforhabdus sp.]|jgi:uncharacterized membrane protein|nr:c-type cytochrome domain-containing protein [Desulforhabdus sp.]
MDSFYEALAKIGYPHPVHPVLTHFLIGLVMAALVFGLAAWVLRSSNLTTTARHCIILALIGAFPTILTGFLDWQHFYVGAWIFPIKMKMLLAMVLLVLLSTTALLALKGVRTSKGILLMYLCCFLTVMAIGYFGGELVFSAKSSVSAAHDGDKEIAPLQTGRSAYMEVAGIFKQHCTICHAGSNPSDGLRLDSYDHIMAGGEEGPVVVAGKPDESELMHRIKGLKQPSMPMGQELLPAEKIQVIEAWISQGAHS